MSQTSANSPGAPPGGTRDASPPSPTVSGETPAAVVAASGATAEEAGPGPPNSSFLSAGAAAATAAGVLANGTSTLPPSLLQQFMAPEGAPLAIPPPGITLPSMDRIPLTDIRTPHPNDVLCGRGGGTNNHCGNEKFRHLVNAQKVRYLHSSKRDKPYVSRGIVRAVRAQIPPGRFVQKNEQTGLWYDIGDQKAREKTSQALREGAPDIRREITTNLVGAAAATGNPVVFTQPNIGAAVAAAAASRTAAPPMSAAALFSAAAASNFALDMERHMRGVGFAEAFMKEQQRNAEGLAEAVSLETTQNNPAAAALLPGLNRAMSSGQKDGLAAVATAAALKEQSEAAVAIGQQQSLFQKQQQQQQQQQLPVLNALSNDNLAQIQQAVAAAGMPFVSLPQLRQAALMADSRTNALNVFPGDNNSRAAAVRAAASGLGPGAFGANVAPSPNLLGFPPAGLVNNSMAAAPAPALANPFLGASGSGFGSPVGSTAVTAATQFGSPVGSIAQSNVAAASSNALTGPQRGVTKHKSPAATIANVTACPSNPQQQRFGQNETENPSAPTAVVGGSTSNAPPLTEDMAFRLVFAETISQKTANGTIRADIADAEKNYTLFLDAGLLGIDPNAIAKHLTEGHSEKEIIQHFQALAVKEITGKNDEENGDATTHNGKEKQLDDKTEGAARTNPAEKDDDDGKFDDSENVDTPEQKEESQDTKGEKNTNNKRPASSDPTVDDTKENDEVTTLKKAKYEPWAPAPSRIQNSQTERRIIDALVCVGAIEKK